MKPSESPETTSTAADPRAVHTDLVSEFARLNATYFDGALVQPEIRLSKRKTFGGYYRPSSHLIVLSWQAYLEHGWEETLNTFRHEVAHIVVPNHSQEFWNLAYRIGVTKKYAASPIHQPARRRRYTYVCPMCDQRVVRARPMRKSSCGRCDKKFNPQFLLKLLPDTARS